MKQSDFAVTMGELSSVSHLLKIRKLKFFLPSAGVLIFEGNVGKSGNRLRISVQLVNAADGYHLWSERYDREMQNIFDVEDEITLAAVVGIVGGKIVYRK